jgi:Fe-S oxidoreductase/nitrate reductase gamma subunit
VTNLFDLPAREVTRDFFFNVGDGYGALRWIVLAACIASFAYFVFSIRKLAEQWSKGEKGLFPGKSMRRIRRVVSDVFLQHRMMEDRRAGISHLLIFWGICGVLFLYSIVFVQEYVFAPFIGIRFLSGYYYLFWALAHDFSFLMMIAGLLVTVFRRYVFAPSTLVTTKRDTCIFVLFAIALVSGILQGAVRIAMSGHPEFEAFSFLSYPLSFMFGQDAGFSLSFFHAVLWWGHLSLGVVFFALSGSVAVPGIMAVGAANIYYSTLDDDPLNRFRISVGSDSAAVRKGVSQIRDFKWKSLMDIDACIHCGRCEENCPVSLTGDSLSPRKFMGDLSALYNETRGSTAASGGEIARRVHRDDMMACTMCGACTDVCPVRVNPMKKIHLVRKYYSGRNPVPDGVEYLRETSCGLIGQPSRSAWFSGVDHIRMFQEGGSEYLYFAGCAPVRDSSAADESRAFLDLMNRSGVSVGVLGDEERCCGDALLRAGDEDSFVQCAEKNLAIFAKYNVTKIVTTCPHGYNVLNKEYRALARKLGIYRSDYEVIHYADLLKDLVASGKLRPKKAPSTMVTYHDSCFLGRYNDKYDSPRDCIDAVPGVVRIEMIRSGRNGFCCGGPLALMKTGGDKMSVFRARDINSSGARLAVTACAYCNHQISKGVESAGIKNLRIVGLAGFLKESL